MRKNYLWYELFRHVIVGPALSLFHSARTLSGAGHVPSDKPVLFVPNHQNSFVDALHVVCNTGRFIHFLTRSDPFEKPLLARFLRSLNMMPVYRAKDGLSTVKKNEEIFHRCYEYLARNDAILIFAEASHDLRRRIRPLSKGFTRIAFGAEERFGWELDLQVIPVGISYGDHRKSLTPVHVEFGECIAVSDYRQMYEEDPRKAANQLKKATAEGMKKLTMHVPNLNHYPIHGLLLDELEPDRKNLLMPETVNSRVASIEEFFDDELLVEAEKLLKSASDHGVRLHDFVSPVRPGIRDLLLSPLYLFALVNNALPYLPARWLVKNAMDDVVFDASVKFLSGLVLFPLFYLLVGFLIALSGAGLLPAAGYMLLSILTAPLFVRALDLLRGSSARKLKKEKPELYDSMRDKVDAFITLRKILFDR